MKKGRVSHLDGEIGARLRTLRLKADLSQEKVAEALGLTFQQIQKYEKGTNSLAPTRLVALARLLRCPVATFFGEDGKGAPVHIDPTLTSRRRIAILARLAEIDSSKIEEAVLELLNAMDGV